MIADYHLCLAWDGSALFVDGVVCQTPLWEFQINGSHHYSGARQCIGNPLTFTFGHANTSTYQYSMEYRMLVHSIVEKPRLTK